MRVENAMTRTPSICRRDTNLAMAAQLMWTGDSGSLTVLDDFKNVIGIANGSGYVD